MASSTTLRNLFTRLTLTPSSLTITTTTTTSAHHAITSSTRTPAAAGVTRAFHTTPAPHARAGQQQSSSPSKSSKRGGKGKKGAAEPDGRIVNLKISTPRRVPAPLRFARNRYLRHWTIHRAWMLYQRRERERRDKELNRMYQSMHSACEELRKTSGPDTRQEGYLYRVAMEKKGLYGHHGVPIEYARPQTETPPREPWNHDWTQ